MPSLLRGQLHVLRLLLLLRLAAALRAHPLGTAVVAAGVRAVSDPAVARCLVAASATLADAGWAVHLLAPAQAGIHVFFDQQPSPLQNLHVHPVSVDRVHRREQTSPCTPSRRKHFKWSNPFSPVALIAQVVLDYRNDVCDSYEHGLPILRSIWSRTFSALNHSQTLLVTDSANIAVIDFALANNLPLLVLSPGPLLHPLLHTDFQELFPQPRAHLSSRTAITDRLPAASRLWQRTVAHCSFTLLEPLLMKRDLKNHNELRNTHFPGLPTLTRASDAIRQAPAIVSEASFGLMQRPAALPPNVQVIGPLRYDALTRRIRINSFFAVDSPSVMVTIDRRSPAAKTVRQALGSRRSRFKIAWFDQESNSAARQHPPSLGFPAVRRAAELEAALRNWNDTLVVISRCDAYELAVVMNLGRVALCLPETPAQFHATSLALAMDTKYRQGKQKWHTMQSRPKVKGRVWVGLPSNGVFLPRTAFRPHEDTAVREINWLGRQLIRLRRRPAPIRAVSARGGGGLVPVALSVAAGHAVDEVLQGRYGNHGPRRSVETRKRKKALGLGCVMKDLGGRPFTIWDTLNARQGSQWVILLLFASGLFVLLRAVIPRQEWPSSPEVNHVDQFEEDLLMEPREMPPLELNLEASAYEGDTDTYPQENVRIRRRRRN